MGSAGEATGSVGLARGSRLTQREFLRRGAVAVPDLQPCAVGGRSAGRVETAPGLRIAQRTVGLLQPDLGAAAVAVPQLHLCAVRGAVAGHVEAAAEGAQRVVGEVLPVLILGVRLA